MRESVMSRHQAFNVSSHGAHCLSNHTKPCTASRRADRGGEDGGGERQGDMVTGFHPVFAFGLGGCTVHMQFAPCSESVTPCQALTLLTIIFWCKRARSCTMHTDMAMSALRCDEDECPYTRRSIGG